MSPSPSTTQPVSAHQFLCRAQWCKVVVALSEKIRKSSGSGTHVRSFAQAGLDMGYRETPRGGAAQRPRLCVDDPLGGLLAAAEHLDDEYSKECLSGEAEDSDSVSGSEEESQEQLQQDRRGADVSAGRSRGGTWRGGGSAQPTFPLKLFDLVTTQSEVIGWVNDGASFQIFDMDVFVERLLPQHFKRKTAAHLLSLKS